MKNWDFIDFPSFTCWVEEGDFIDKVDLKEFF